MENCCICGKTIECSLRNFLFDFRGFKQILCCFKFVDFNFDIFEGNDIKLTSQFGNYEIKMVIFKWLLNIRKNFLEYKNIY